MLIEVTQKDIDKGMPSKAHACPVALAVKRHFKKAGSVSVSSYGVAVTDYPVPKIKFLPFQKDKWFLMYRLPRIATEFIIDFDSYGEVAPFAFELTEVPYIKTKTSKRRQAW